MLNWLSKVLTGYTADEIGMLVARMKFLEIRVDDLQVKNGVLEQQLFAKTKEAADLNALVDTLKRKKDSVFSQESIENFVGGLR